MGPRQRYHQRHSAKTHIVPIIIASFFGFLFLTVAAFGIGMIGVIDGWLQDLPDYTDTDLYLSSEPTTILDADENVIASFYTENRTTVSLDEISQYVLDGTVATEDERFYEHGGFDPVGILRAAWVQLTGGSEGASTITQQLVRNTILQDEQFDMTIERKVREIYLAVKVEETFTKDEILNMYLNAIYYGHGAYGIEAAAQTYLSKSASELTLAEAALLIGLPNAPSTYDPTVNPDLAIQRRNTVLNRMYTNGYITEEERDAAQAEELVLNVSETSDTGVDIESSPYFVEYVQQLLADEFDYDQIFSGGLTVYTTIQSDVQEAAETAVTDQLGVYDLDGLEAGMTVIDNDTGYIVAMVGGTDYYADDEHVNHATSQRQTGSSFKAFTLATAIEEGMNPDIIIDCTSPQYFDDGTYRVGNINNVDYGYISLARATEVSSNTGYVRVQKAVGVENVIEMCHRLGIEDELEAVTSLTLGTQSLSTLQMAEAYSTFATGGIHRDAVAITKITNRNGETIYEYEDSGERVLDAAVASTVTDILEGVISNGTATSAQLSVNQPFAGKTGTTDGSTDLWFCGYTPQYTAAIWVGYTAGSIEITINGSYASTSNFPIPIARNFFNTVLEGVEREEFPEGGTPTYKDNSVWTVDGEPLDSSSATSSTTEADTESEEDLLDSDTTNETTDASSSAATSDTSSDSDASSSTTVTSPTTTPDSSTSTDTSTTTPDTGSGSGSDSSGDDGT